MASKDTCPNREASYGSPDLPNIKEEINTSSHSKERRGYLCTRTPVARNVVLMVLVASLQLTKT